MLEFIAAANGRDMVGGSDGGGLCTIKEYLR